MLPKKIIPCLDVKDGKVVKGINFEGVKEVGDPVEYAKEYCANGADELVFLDITATTEGRKNMLDVIRKTAAAVTIPFVAGGGIRTLEDMEDTLKAGADKVSVNTAAVKNPMLIADGAAKFGSQRIVAAIDVKSNGRGGYHVLINGGKTDTGIDAVSWARTVERLGAGEILLTSLDADGTKKGYDLEATDLIAKSVKIPVTASGGCGSIQDIVDVFEKTDAASALAASLFHYHEETPRSVKAALKKKGIPVAGI